MFTLSAGINCIIIVYLCCVIIEIFNWFVILLVFHLTRHDRWLARQFWYSPGKDPNFTGADFFLLNSKCQTIFLSDIKWFIFFVYLRNICCLNLFIRIKYFTTRIMFQNKGQLLFLQCFHNSSHYWLWFQKYFGHTHKTILYKHRISHISLGQMRR